MRAPSDARGNAPEWEALGFRIADVLDGCASVVVLADEASEAALVALGLARAQARHERVAVVDLVGDIPALQEQLPADAPYGLVDCVQYGVSLGKVAYPIDPAKNLFIVPSGVGPIDHEALLHSSRWRALMRTFRQADTLMLLVVDAHVSDVGELVHQTDGVVAVGDVSVPDDWRVVTRVQPQVDELVSELASAPVEYRETASSADTTSDADMADAADAVDVAPAPERARRAAPPVDAPRSPRSTPWFMFVLVGALVIIAGGTWMWYTRRAPAAGPLVATVEHDSAFARDTATDARTPDSSAARPGMAIANPADSAAAAAYAVTLVTFNTAAAAEAQVDRSNRQGLPAVTISYVALGADSSRWYRVFVGAYRSRSAADSLLGALRGRGILAEDAGRVVRAPLAVLVRDKVPFSDAHTVASAYRAKGIPVYALVQDDGSYTLYAGAFESPEQATLLLSTLRAAGEDPVVVYRTGRVL